MKGLAVAVVCLILFNPPAFGTPADIPGESRISEVTVFPDRAMVTRIADVELGPGEQVVVLGGLPATLVERSLRAGGAGSADFLIGSVENRLVFHKELVRTDEERLRLLLQGLRDEDKRMEDEVAALNIRLDFIKSIGTEIPKTAGEEIVRGSMDPGAWEKAWNAVGDGAGITLAQIQKIEVERRALAERIAKAEKELAQVLTGRRESREARIHVETRKAGAARLTLTYQIPGAGWRPMYDARLSSGTGAVQLRVLAEVVQNTGEDWQEADLIVSTARPAKDANLPDIDSWFIDFVRIFGAVSGAEAPAPILKRRLGEDAEGKESVAAETARVVAGEFAAEYMIPGTSTVASDGAAHTFVLEEHSLEATLEARAVPAVTPEAYVSAEVRFDGEAPLLPGRVSVFRDGVYVGTADLKLLRPGEIFTMSFGVDDRIRVRYRLATGEHSRQGVFNRQHRVERRYTIEVDNTHDRPMEITVLDRIPVPQDERIGVELLKDSTTPTLEDVDGKKGVLAWTASYAPGEKRVIRFGYAVTYPVGETVSGF